MSMWNENHRKLVKIATLYYQEGLTQAEIGKMMKISRPVVSKLLQQAKEAGVVSIFIHDETSHAVSLGIELQKKYQLKEAIVIPVVADQPFTQIKRRVAVATADYLLSRLPQIQSIGLSWGTTLADVIEELPYVSYPQVKAVPLVGGVSANHLYYDTNHLVFELAEKIKGSCRYFYAPALAESDALAKALKESQMVSEAVNVAKEVDIALIGVGNPHQYSTWNELGYIDAQEEREFFDPSIQGDAVASLFDKNGKTIDNKVTRRMLGIRVEDFQEMQEVVLVAAGIQKSPSLAPLLQEGSNKTLIIDQSIAENLLEDQMEKSE